MTTQQLENTGNEKIVHDMLAIQSPVRPRNNQVLDQLNRPLKDLRISVTDRCNFRCQYCMPKQVFGKDFNFIQHGDMLSFEEITRIAQCFATLGISKIRLTGGEPLLRRNIERLISYLSAIKTPSGKQIDLTLTTNGSVLLQKAQTLFDAGLKRITVSLDALDDKVFRKINDVDFPVKTVLKAIDKAIDTGFSPIKVNAVIRKGINESQILPLAKYFRNSPVVLRFIEYMDVGNSNTWSNSQITPSAEIQRIIDSVYPLEPLQANYLGETAQRWKYKDGKGEIGIIASITQPFCAECTRLRLSTEGKLYPCLFSNQGFDLKKLIRSESTDTELIQVITAYWANRNNRYSELRKTGNMSLDEHKIEMHYIGG